MRSAIVALAILASLASLSGCYRPQLDRCAVTCTDTCPGDLTCRGGFCYAPGDDQVCTGGPGDDAAVDADEPDARPQLAAIKELAAGENHVCAIDDGGHLWCWGGNRYLALARTGILRSSVPVEIDPSVTSWSRVVGGGGHTCAIAAGILYCWGDNGAGQTGHEDPLTVARPVAVAGKDWVEVSAGRSFSCGLQDVAGVRTISCWGFDYVGQLGDGNIGDNPRATPAEVARVGGTERVTNWTTLSSSADHTCALRAGAIYCWGGNQSFECGIGGTSRDPVSTPTKIADVGVTSWSAVSAGNAFTCAIGDHKLWCWGTSDNHELGRGPGDSSTPVLVDDKGTWTAVAAGDDGACGIRDGDVLCWGSDSVGQLGTGRFDDLLQAPVTVEGLRDAKGIAHGNAFACALDAGRHAHCWGSNAQGQIGDGTQSSQWKPERIGTLGGWRQVAAGLVHTCAIRDGDSDRELYCWGRGSSAALGVPGSGDRITPVRVTGVTSPRSLAVGDDHTCVVRDDGELWCWGNGAYGAVGNGMNTGLLEPTHVDDPHRYDAITATVDSTCGLIGTARWCWGYNEYGGLGVSGDSVVLSPLERTEAPAAWKQLALGRDFGCGITAGNPPDADRLACWGSHAGGRRGDGTTTGSVVTPAVIGSGYRAVASGLVASHACAITTAGALHCWGLNDDGQLGVGGRSARTTPSTVPGSRIWTDVAVGPRHSCGLTGGSLYCWGSNDDAALGLDGIELADMPAQVDKVRTWKQLSIGASHTCAITADPEAALYCWGTNTHGQLGDGQRDHPLPTAVVAPSP